MIRQPFEFWQRCSVHVVPAQPPEPLPRSGFPAQAFDLEARLAATELARDKAVAVADVRRAGPRRSLLSRLGCKRGKDFSSLSLLFANKACI